MYEKRLQNTFLAFFLYKTLRGFHGRPLDVARQGDAYQQWQWRLTRSVVVILQTLLLTKVALQELLELSHGHGVGTGARVRMHFCSFALIDFEERCVNESLISFIGPDDVSLYQLFHSGFTEVTLECGI